ncbi:MAG TPA: class II aldolase/adducin family protein [Candidatus Binatia bacterium]
MASIQETKEIVAESCRILGKLNLTKEATGHVSARIEGTDRILIRARGPQEEGVRFTTAHEVITADLNGNKLDGDEGFARPQEVFIHTWIYKTRPEVNSVVHIHPPTVVLFTICNKPLLPLYGAYDPSGLRLYLDGIARYPRSILISNDERGQEFAAALGDKRVCLMRGHGITSVGASVEEATVTAIKLNQLAEMNYQAALLGTPEAISDEDIQAFANIGHMVTEGGRRTTGHLTSAWRYYSRLLGGEEPKK